MAKSGFYFKNGMTEQLKKMKKIFTDRSDPLAKKKCAIQLLTWTVTGSPKEKTVPPIADGFLRGSASVFVGDKYIEYHGKDDDKYANKSNSETSNKDIITLGFNVPYAYKMHEHTGNWGAFSLQAGNVGNKFLERHIKHDSLLLLKLYAMFLKKDMEKELGPPPRSKQEAIRRTK